MLPSIFRRAVWTVTVAAATLSATSFGTKSPTSANILASECSHFLRAKAEFAALKLGHVKKRLENASDTDVIKNDLNIEAVPATSTLIGTNVMTIESKVGSLTQFTFRLADNFTISQVLLNGNPISYARLDSATVRAELGTSFSSGQQFALKVSYSGVPVVGAGFDSIVFRTRSGAQEVFTLSEPFYAYTWWPEKDENDDKALIDIAITVPDTMIVAANGLLMGIDSIPGGKLKYRWSSQYQIAPYLVSFAATNFNTWTDSYIHSGGAMPLSFFIYPENDTPSNRAGWTACKQMLATFATVFGEYPFVNEKYGIYNFGFGGGMEHQTITGQGGFSESVTAHELTHQWWGDMVTCETWHDIWLNEGFATYGEALWLERKPGSSGFPALKSAMQNRRPTSMNGSVYRYDISNVNTIFSTNFTYRKGAWVLHQLRHIVGDSTFFSILAEYRNQYEYDSAISEDFIAVSETVSGRDLRWFFDPWIYEVGAPTYRWGSQSVTVDGLTYLLVRLRQTQSAPFPIFTMPVDFRFTVGGSPITSSLWNTAAVQHYVIPVTGAASAPSLDPDGWILNSSITSETYVPGPPKIVKVDPQPGTGSANQISLIKLTFHTPIVATTQNFSVKTNMGVPMAFKFSYDGPTNTVFLKLLPGNRISGIVVTVSDAITAMNSGMALDGETPDFHTVPTGDGLPGGNAVIHLGY